VVADEVVVFSSSQDGESTYLLCLLGSMLMSRIAISIRVKNEADEFGRVTEGGVQSWNGIPQVQSWLGGL